VLSRNDDATFGGGGEVGFAPVQLPRVDQGDVVDAVFACQVGERRHSREFCLVPGHHDTAGLEDRQIEAVLDFQILPVTSPDAGELQRSRSRVIPGMKHGAIGFAGARQDVRPGLDHQRLQAGQSETPEQRAPHDPGADDSNLGACYRIICGHACPAVIGNRFRTPSSEL
jgi:hypothetical protein